MQGEGLTRFATDKKLFTWSQTIISLRLLWSFLPTSEMNKPRPGEDWELLQVNCNQKVLELRQKLKALEAKFWFILLFHLHLLPELPPHCHSATSTAAPSSSLVIIILPSNNDNFHHLLLLEHQAVLNSLHNYPTSSVKWYIKYIQSLSPFLKWKLDEEVKNLPKITLARSNSGLFNVRVQEYKPYISIVKTHPDVFPIHRARGLQQTNPS